MRRQGFTIIELLVAVTIFMVGVMSLAMVLTFDLSVVTRSRETINVDQALVNEVNEYMLARVLSNDVTAADSPNAANVSSDQPLKIDTITLNFSLYKFQGSERESVVYHVIQREE